MKPVFYKSFTPTTFIEQAIYFAVNKEEVAIYGFKWAATMLVSSPICGNHLYQLA
jgi:hypothetical protein